MDITVSSIVQFTRFGIWNLHPSSVEKVPKTQTKVVHKQPKLANHKKTSHCIVVKTGYKEFQVKTIGVEG